MLKVSSGELVRAGRHCGLDGAMSTRSMPYISCLFIQNNQQLTVLHVIDLLSKMVRLQAGFTTHFFYTFVTRPAKQAHHLRAIHSMHTLRWVIDSFMVLHKCVPSLSSITHPQVCPSAAFCCCCLLACSHTCALHCTITSHPTGCRAFWLGP